MCEAIPKSGLNFNSFTYLFIYFIFLYNCYYCPPGMIQILMNVLVVEMNAIRMLSVLTQMEITTLPALQVLREMELIAQVSSK